MQFNWWLLVHHHLIAYFASMISMWRIYVTNTFSVTIVHISLYIRTAHSNIFSPKKIHTSCWTSEFAQCSAPLVHNSWLRRWSIPPLLIRNILKSTRNYNTNSAGRRHLHVVVVFRPLEVVSVFGVALTCREHACRIGGPSGPLPPIVGTKWPESKLARSNSALLIKCECDMDQKSWLQVGGCTCTRPDLSEEKWQGQNGHFEYPAGPAKKREHPARFFRMESS